MSETICRGCGEPIKGTPRKIVWKGGTRWAVVAGIRTTRGVYHRDCAWKRIDELDVRDRERRQH